MDATTIIAALDAAELALSQGDSHAARQHIAAARAADAGGSVSRALEAEYRAWPSAGPATCSAGGGMPRDFAARTALAILLAVVALVVGLMRPSFLGLAVVIGVVSMLITPSPP